MNLRLFKAFLLAGVLLQISCEPILFEEDIREEIMVLLAPKNETDVSAGEVFFSWEELEGAERYHLLVATPNFETANQILIDSLVVGRSFSQELVSKSYEWKIRGVNSGYKTAYTNASFEVVESTEFPSTKVLLLTPKTDLNTNSITQNLSWQTLPEVLDYRVQIWNPDTNGILVSEGIVSATNFDIEFDEGNFTWQVRGQNATQNTLYSARSLLVDTTDPDSVTLSTPVDATVLTAGLIDFSWSRTSISGSVEMDSLYVFEDTSLTLLNFKVGVTDFKYQKELETGEYFWCIQSFDAAGNYNTKTDTFSFELE